MPPRSDEIWVQDLLDLQHSDPDARRKAEEVLLRVLAELGWHEITEAYELAAARCGWRRKMQPQP